MAAQAIARAAFMRRRRVGTLVEADDVPLGAHEVELLPGEVPLGLVEQLLGFAVLARDARERQARALPEVVVIDLGHGRAETVLQLRLGGLDVLALAFEGARLRKVQLDAEDADVSRSHGAIEPCCKASV